jgi:hypothetical protein
MPTRSASCKASAPDRTAYPVSSNSLLDGMPRQPWQATRVLRYVRWSVTQQVHRVPPNAQAMSNRNGVGWPRVFAEGVLIVTSILLALALDAWWDDVQEDRRRTELLEALTVDFETTRVRLAASIALGDSLVAGTGAFLVSAASATPLPVDSLRVLASQALRPFEFRPATSSYEGARASGDLQLLRSRELIKAFAEFDQSMTYFEDRSRVHLEWFYLGGVAKLREELGSQFPLMPPDAGGGAFAPFASRPGASVSDDEFLKIARTRAVQGRLEGGLVLRMNLVRGLREADEAAAKVIEALRDLRVSG